MMLDSYLKATYLPRKAAAEVSNHNEPVGRKSGIQLVRKLTDFPFSCFDLFCISVELSN